MGSFNSQYENYYSTLSKKGHIQNNLPYSRQTRIENKFFSKSKILKIIQLQLAGTLILFMCAFICKFYVNPQTKAVYSYSKNIVSENFDYKSSIRYLKSIDVNSLIIYVKSANITEFQSKIINWIDSVKTKIIGGRTTKDNISNNFMMPVSGKIMQGYSAAKDSNTSKNQLNKGITIYSSINSSVKASYRGVIKEVGEDKTVGKYLVIDHGSGIETKYAHMNSIKVKKGDIVTKGEIIGDLSNNDEGSSLLYFQLIYMGENLNPQEFDLKE